MMGMAMEMIEMVVTLYDVLMMILLSFEVVVGPVMNGSGGKLLIITSSSSAGTAA